LPEHLEQFTKQPFHLDKPPPSARPGCEGARIWTDKSDAARAQGFHICLDRRVCPHLEIHRGRDYEGSTGSKRGEAHHVVTDPVGELREDVRSGRCNHEEVGALPDRDMPFLRLTPRLVGCGPHAPLGERGKRQRRNEACRGFRHQDIHHCPCFHAQTRKFCDFICRNTPRHAEGDMRARCHARVIPSHDSFPHRLLAHTFAACTSSAYPLRPGIFRSMLTTVKSAIDERTCATLPSSAPVIHVCK